jgi:hypothetical protein
MINLGVIGNFINLAFIGKLEILRKIKVVPEPIIGLNGENLGTLIIILKSGLVLIVMLGYFEWLNFNVILMGWYDVVLGIP